MKKTLLSLAVVAGMAASGAALAEATVYGNLHLSIDNPDNEGSSVDSMEMNNQTSAIGVKGSEDLGDGMKAFFKAEFQVDPSTSGSLTGRDQYIGLKGGMGTVKFGSMSSNYKQKGGSVDPMYRTALEGRGGMQMQSALHGGNGPANGRMDDLVQYSSPKMGGMQMVINTTFNARVDTTGPSDENIDETIGVGFRYEAKAFSVYVDYLDFSYDATESESATKIGGTFKPVPVKLGVQLEQTEALLGSDYMMVSANYSLDKNNGIYFAYGTRSDLSDGSATLSDSGSSSFALMYNHKMSKNTNVYVGYGTRSSDDNAIDVKTLWNSQGVDVNAEGDFDVMTAGMRVKF